MALLVALASMASLCGCGPEVKLDQVSVISEQDWGLTAAPGVDGHVLLTPETDSLFPSHVAIARIRACDARGTSETASASAPKWSIWPLKTEDAAYWNMLMPDVPEIGQLLVLDPPSTIYSTVDLKGFAAAARRSRAGLCLMYGVTSDNPEDYRMSGLLLESSAARKVAVIRACVTPQDFELRAPERHSTDLRHMDPANLCARKFEARVRDCLLDMIAHDHMPSTQPSPWKDGLQQSAPPTVIIMPR